MDNLLYAPNKWNAKKRECKAIVETPKGCRNKFDYDPDYGLFALGGLLPEGLAFPFDFGFIPSTLGGDGDPLDAIILADEPAHVGCMLDQLEEFFISYNKSRGKKFRVKGRHGPKRAAALLEAGRAQFAQEK